MSAASVLYEIVELLRKRGTPYAVLGGFAVRTHGIPRPTYDVDIMIELARESVGTFLDELSDAGFEVPEVYRTGWVDAVREMPILKLKRYHEDGAVDLDVFLADNRFQREAMKRRVRACDEDFEVWSVSAEDLVLFKLLANRNRDWSDVGDILFIQGTLDVEYMRRWAAELGIAERLEQALRGSSETSR